MFRDTDLVELILLVFALCLIVLLVSVVGMAIRGTFIKERIELEAYENCLKDKPIYECKMLFK